MAKSPLSELPLFPLGQVLVPGGQMGLRIFEARYLDLVGRCMREDSGFGVVLIRRGTDTYGAGMGQPEIHDVGTVARIVDFDQAEAGQLAIRISGGRKFRIAGTREQADHLLLGDVELLPEEGACPVDVGFEGLTALLRQIMRHPAASGWSKDGSEEMDLGDARTLGWRLADLLPFPPEVKQTLLQMTGAVARLIEIRRLVEGANRGNA
ncbi:MAG: LON peptidase substrate-binding domain-containing protein [Gammaproteobacteria bacterium]|nr:LON peptidase substrate-binding domain-containing protein [Gammaproteobacteria bacterium]